MFLCLHNLFNFQKFCACLDDQFLVLNEPHDNRCRDSEKYWPEVPYKERFNCILISRFISLIFLSTSGDLNILSFTSYFMILKILYLFVRFQFWAPTRFPEIICPRYGPD